MVLGSILKQFGISDTGIIEIPLCFKPLTF